MPISKEIIFVKPLSTIRENGYNIPTCLCLFEHSMSIVIQMFMALLKNFSFPNPSHYLFPVPVYRHVLQLTLYNECSTYVN